ncbi:OsmC family protein [Puerhibacterium puerhi]|uniref:OsmC family protein n=1 Tax=Puerhibacterium puerhi TaxID=2692623 RepID=UPI001356B0F1|nr:OsmC family protein [Puerhibacterium puerhi]
MTHTYATRLTWQGSTGEGYRAYSRDHAVAAAPAEQELALSADPAFRGSPERLNPEQLVVAAASSCQLLSFLAVAARAGVDVRGYADDATSTLDLSLERPRLTAIRLAVVVEVAPGTDHATVERLAHEAHEECYIANSLAVPVELEVKVVDAA